MVGGEVDPGGWAEHPPDRATPLVVETHERDLIVELNAVADQGRDGDWSTLDHGKAIGPCEREELLHRVIRPLLDESRVQRVRGRKPVQRFGGEAGQRRADCGFASATRPAPGSPALRKDRLDRGQSLVKAPRAHCGRIHALVHDASPVDDRLHAGLHCFVGEVPVYGYLARREFAIPNASSREDRLKDLSHQLDVHVPGLMRLCSRARRRRHR
jgi:hypothetical protein